MLTFGSLFAGIGGFDLGFERAGLRCAWSVEIDDKCNEVRSHHWPDVKQYKDVKNVGRNNLEPVDIICGGFPCQDLSVAGRRAGLAGERSGLWWEFHRIIEELQPRWAVIENVPGLLSSNKGRDMGTIIRALGELGYGYAWTTLDAQYFGLAQRRRRVFIVGCLGDWRGAAQVLFEPESGERNSAPSRETGQSVTNSITKSLGGGSPDDNKAQGGFLTVAPTLTAPDPNAPKRDGKRQDGSRTDKIPIVFQPRYYTRDNNTGGSPQNTVALALTAHSGEGDSAPVVAFNWYRPSLAEGVNISPTLSDSGGQAPAVMNFGVRRLTPRECERLQGFPDTWTAVNGMSDSARYRMLGNAVAVPVAEWIGGRIVNQGNT